MTIDEQVLINLDPWIRQLTDNTHTYLGHIFCDQDQQDQEKCHFNDF
jgi:hypothetical protein